MTTTPKFTFNPSPQLAAEALLRGHSIQGGNVYDNLGGLWHAFATHEEAVAAVEAFRRGVDVGKEIGAREARKTICDALGIHSPIRNY